ncbi:hypothetical protein [Shewanella youngdeokensis]|uniref:Uracil-DNA glycosylase-like domain-containing protein n=1 Tax=Shewanella youngdeokensis TaxID=2999068 RepID=A0ABZ0JYK9_9GAMM|nr:hypothetical protein RGE70_00755 [Shewanella sp. DAU334]
MTLPVYGHIACRKCFKHCLSEQSFQPHPLWQMRNDPGSWGGDEPEILILGFSKGSTQADIYQQGEFDDIAFGGPARARLDTLLKRLGLLLDHENVSTEIANTESRFAFGSLVRCSLARENHLGSYATSGDLITKSFFEIPEILDNCTEQFLSFLPSKTQVVLMLGITDKYITSSYELLKKCYPSLCKVNDVSYGDNNRTFIHVTHPSPGNGHFSSWCKGNAKFDDALAALEQRSSFGGISSPSLQMADVEGFSNARTTQKNFLKDVIKTPYKKETARISQSSELRENLVPVSTVATFCVPFNIEQKGTKGFEIGENPVKQNGQYVDTFDEAIKCLRKMKNPSWRAHGKGPGNCNGGARKAVLWVTKKDAMRLYEEKDNNRRVSIFQSLSDVYE